MPLYPSPVTPNAGNPPDPQRIVWRGQARHPFVCPACAGGIAPGADLVGLANGDFIHARCPLGRCDVCGADFDAGEDCAAEEEVEP